MEQLILENRLLSSIQTTDDLLLCQKEGVTRETFVVAVPNHGDVWEYIEEHVRNHNKIPTRSDIKAIYGFDATEPGDLRTYIKGARSAEVAAKARSLLVNKAESLSANPREAIREIITGLSTLQTSGNRRELYLDRDASTRMEHFKKARKELTEGGILGIPTGLSTFDKQGLGFRRGEVVVVIGGTGVGKSWLVTYMAVIAYEHDNKILMISPELTAEEVGQRFDVLLAHQRGVKLSNMDIMLGQANFDLYKKWLIGLKDTHRFGVIDSSDTGKRLTFADIWRYVREHRPDMLVVDGLQLIAGDGKKEKGWEALKEGIEYLKSVAVQEKIVIIVAHQPNRDASKKNATTAPGLEKIGYAFAVAETADRVISIARVPGKETFRQYMVPKIRAGATIVDTRMLLFDVDTGNIREETNAEKYHADDF